MRSLLWPDGDIGQVNAWKQRRQRRPTYTLAYSQWSMPAQAAIRFRTRLKSNLSNVMLLAGANAGRDRAAAPNGTITLDGTARNLSLLQGSSLPSVLVLSPGEILPLRRTSHPTPYIVRDKALLSPFSGVASI